MQQTPFNFSFVPSFCTAIKLHWRRTLVLFVLYSASSSLLLFSSCNNQSKHINRDITPAFYYWKSVFRLSDFETQQLDTLRVRTLYIKFFDVAWDDISNKAIPNAKLLVAGNKQLKDYDIIPTVFITNECFQNIDTTQIAALAKNIHILITNTINNTDIRRTPEIQFDCDWTASTKDKYFQFLKEYKLLTERIPISATIRLHQIKYIAKTGIPPVTRGLLMCYNMGNLKSPATKNSILETEELKKYIGSLENYPLPLDVAFPLFDWYVLFRNNQYKGLIENIPINNPAIEETNTTTYFLLRDTIINGIEFKKDDILRHEKSEYKEIMATADCISQKLQTKNLKLALFDLDSLTLRKYSTNELENIYNSLR